MLKLLPHSIQDEINRLVRADDHGFPYNVLKIFFIFWTYVIGTYILALSIVINSLQPYTVDVHLVTFLFLLVLVYLGYWLYANRQLWLIVVGLNVLFILIGPGISPFLLCFILNCLVVPFIVFKHEWLYKYMSGHNE